ncbi:hypothetical protein DFH09DRAFT_1166357 [Mycena vulgaris]|nr:hypothetical protein DFH09DRAFT_1166357 [Mycena vulgaris]
MLSKAAWRRAFTEESITNPFGPGLKTFDQITFEQGVGPYIDFLRKDMASGLDSLDNLLPSFTLHTTSDPSAAESKAHKGLGVVALDHVGKDEPWVDMFLQDSALAWKDRSISYYNTGDLTRVLNNNTTVRKETSLDQFATDDGVIASAVCGNLDGFVAKSIRTEGQRSTQLPSGGNVALFYAHESTKSNSPYRLIERRENKTLEFMLSHAHDLEVNTNKVLEKLKGMLTQASASSTSTEENFCQVVWMGHPSLYRIGYIYNQTLFVSGWRSAEPARMKEVLNRIKKWSAPISQAHFVRETLAFANTPAEKVSEFCRTRQRPTIPSTIARFLRVAQDPFDALGRILMPRVVLGGNCFYGRPRFLCEPFPLDFPLVIKSRLAVDSEELRIWDRLAQLGLSGVPAPLGIMQLHSKPNTDQTLLFSENCGEPVEEEALEVEAEDNHSIFVRSSISRILVALRGGGIHHHDVHCKNVLWKDGRVYLTDFGRATAAVDCLEGEDCPDLSFICRDDLVEVLDLIPSTSQSSQSSTEAPTTASPHPSPPQPHSPLKDDA